MKKSVLFCLFFYLALGLGAEDYFVSNSSAMRIRPFNGEDWQQQEWILAESAQGNNRTITLYHFGREDSRREQLLDGAIVLQEAVYVNNRQTSLVRNNADGQIAEQINYTSSGNISERQEYEYDESGRLMNIRYYDGQDQLLYQDRYAFRPNGTIRRVVRYRNDEPVVSQNWISDRQGAVTEVWIQRPGELQLVEKREDGHIIRIRYFQEGVLQRRTIYDYSDSGALLSETAEDFTSKDKRVQLYTPSGKVRQDTYYADGLLVSLTRFTYNDSEVLIRRETSGQGRQDVVEYSYNNRKLAEERHYTDEDLVKVITYLADAVRKEELYRGGKPFLTLTYEDDVLTDELWSGTIFNIRNDE